MIKKSFLFILLSFLFCSLQLFSQSIINPATGVWANKQILVLDVPYGASAYYSVSGNDPETSGFAYDGPVLLDVDGDVILKITVVRADGSKFMRNILYTVKKTDYPSDSDASNFVKKYEQMAFADYVVGGDLKIPSSLEYSFGPPPECFEKGKSLRIDTDNVISRYLPCTVSDGKAMWRFIIHVTPVMTGIFTRRDVPFEIVNWDTISFSNKKFIYKIDDGWWQQPKLPVRLDRNEKHIISWQSIDFSNENSIRLFILPSQPEIKIDRDSSGIVTVSSAGESGYKFGIIESNGTISELYDFFKIDTFQGDCFEGVCKTGVFYDSVYQGEFQVDFRVNKRMPQKPVITSSAQNNFSRSVITLNIQKAPDTKLYVSVQGPIIIDSANYTNDVLMVLQEPKYEYTEGTSFLLQPPSDGASAYKISAYCMDSNGNKSSVAEYSAVIDACNYYVDSSKNSPAEISVADGTKAHPYANIESVLPFLDESRFLNVFLDGDATLPNKDIVISSNFQITGRKDARLYFSSGTSLLLRDSSLSIENCLVSYSKKAEKPDLTSSLIQLERSVLDLNDVEFSATFGRNGTIVSGDNSVVNVRSSVIASSAENYTAIITCVESKIFVKDSNVSSLANTSVNFSAQGGIFELRNSNCKVSGGMGRIAELFDTQSSITDNSFFADLKKSQANTNPIYTDTKNVSLEYSKNKISGF